MKIKKIIHYLIFLIFFEVEILAKDNFTNNYMMDCKIRLSEEERERIIKSKGIHLNKGIRLQAYKCKGSNKFIFFQERSNSNYSKSNKPWISIKNDFSNSFSTSGMENYKNKKNYLKFLVKSISGDFFLKRNMINAENPTLDYRYKGENYRLRMIDNRTRNYNHFKFNPLTSSIKLYETNKNVIIEDNKIVNYKPRIFSIEKEIDPCVDKSNLVYISGCILKKYSNMTVYNSDLNSKNKINGSIKFFDVIKNRKMFEKKLFSKLRVNIEGFNLDSLILVPWFEYDNLNVLNNDFLTKSEYLILMQNSINDLKKEFPFIKLFAALPSNLISLDAKLNDHLNKKELNKGFFKSKESDLNEKIFAYIENLGGSKDSLIINEDLSLTLENFTAASENSSYFKNKNLIKPGFAVAGFINKDNFLKRRILEQVRFLINDVGFDGIYIDQFNINFDEDSLQRFLYKKNNFGKIRKFDASILSSSYRRELIDEIKPITENIILNTFSNTNETDLMNVIRFSETFWELTNDFSRSNLASKSMSYTPLGFAGSYSWQENKINYVFDFSYSSLSNGTLPISFSIDQKPLLISNKIFPIENYIAKPNVIVSPEKIITNANETIINILDKDKFQAIYFSCKNSDNEVFSGTDVKKLKLSIEKNHKCILVAML